MTLGLIWAQARGGVIGHDGRMPWHLPEDLAHFRDLTLGTTVVMGRRTWDSIDPRFRPLPDRRNVVVTRDPSWTADGATVVHSIDEALHFTPDWIIGGSQLYASTIPIADHLEVTEIDLSVDGDTHAPAIDASWSTSTPTPRAEWLTSRTGLRYRFVSYSRA